MTTHTAPLLKAALVEALLGLYPAGSTTAVLYGDPGPWSGAEVVSVGNIVTARTMPRAGTRTVDDAHTITVTISVAQRGGSDAQRPCTERAYGILDELDTYLRGLPRENLGVDAVAWVVVGDHELIETALTDDRRPEAMIGRSAALIVNVNATAHRV